MKKLISLLKATMSQDMNLFKINTNNKNKYKNLILILVLICLVMYSIGVYAFEIGNTLKQTGQTYIILTIFVALTAILSFIEAIYKSQGILFEAKDNDLLFSLPIEKGKILFSRLTKLLVFQFFYNALFLIPAMGVYIILEKPGIQFYFTSIIMLFINPIIPTVLGSTLGYLIKAISSKFKATKIIQTIITMALFLLVFFASFNLKNVLGTIANNAQDINQKITTIFYSAELYINLINKFDAMKFLILLAINIIPLILYVYIAKISYFNIIFKLSEKNNNIGKTKNNKEKNKTYKKNSKLKSLVLKELKRYFSSPIYIFNTSFGIILMLIITIGMIINLNGMIGIVLNDSSMGLSMEQIISIMPKVYLELVIFISCMTQITASSISLEGKSFNITKSLPVKTEKILVSKIVTSNIITIPLMLISDVIFFIAYRVTTIDIIFISTATIVVPTVIAIMGLLVNLQFPKMQFSSDTEVVKQSMSTFIAVLIGFVIAIASIVLMNILSSIFNINLISIIELIGFIILGIILWIILKTYGIKKFLEIQA